MGGFSFGLAAQIIERKRCQLCCRVQLHSVWVTWKYVSACSWICGCVHEKRYWMCTCASRFWLFVRQQGATLPLFFFFFLWWQKTLTGLSAHMRWQQWASCLSLVTVFTLNSERFSRATDSTAAQHPKGLRGGETQPERDSSERMGGYFCMDEPQATLGTFSDGRMDDKRDKRGTMMLQSGLGLGMGARWREMQPW